MYTTNLVDACFHCLETSKANIAVVEDEKQLEKILSVKSRLPHLKAIIQYEGKPTVDGVLSVSFYCSHNTVHNDLYKYYNAFQLFDNIGFCSFNGRSS